MDVQCEQDRCVTASMGDLQGQIEERETPVVDRTRFRHAMGNFATGLTLATTAAAQEWHGATANAVMSVSLDPPLVLLSIQVDSRMYRALEQSDNYALNLLTDRQEHIARYFSDSSVSHSTEAFDSLAHHHAATGAPLLDDTLATLDCRIVERYRAGDHLLYLGRVVYLELGEPVEPLLYFRGRFR
jgi:flavin reductase (DIM6/NTAB) family NADH-FMN oxidoreductase RutF